MERPSLTVKVNGPGCSAQVIDGGVGSRLLVITLAEVDPKGGAIKVRAGKIGNTWTMSSVCRGQELGCFQVKRYGSGTAIGVSVVAAACPVVKIVVAD